MAFPARGHRRAAQEGRWRALRCDPRGARGDPCAPAGCECRRDHGGIQPPSARKAAPPRLEHQAHAVSSGVCREKKRLHSLEQLRPDVVAKRAAFWRTIRHVAANRLVFLDESGLNTSMTRSHAWVKK